MLLRPTSSNMTKIKIVKDGKKMQKRYLRYLTYVKGRVFRSKHFPLCILKRNIKYLLLYETRHKTSFKNFRTLRFHFEAMCRGETVPRHMEAISDGFSLWLGARWARMVTLNQGATPESMVHAAQSLWLKQPQLLMQQCNNLMQQFKGIILYPTEEFRRSHADAKAAIKLYLKPWLHAL